MKKFLVLLFSLSLLLPFTSTKGIEGQKSANKVAYTDSYQSHDHPIYPPVG